MSAAATTAHTSSSGASSEALKAMLASGNGSDAILMHLLDRSQLPSDQTDLLKLMIGAGVFSNDDDAIDDHLEEDHGDELDWDDDPSSFDSVFKDFEPQSEEAGCEDHQSADQEPDSQGEDDLVAVNDTLASALGACRYCWGGDDNCAACSGKGKPGSLMPDAQLFRELVVPAVKRVRSGDRSVHRPMQHSSQKEQGNGR
ncbi:MAG: hypothetical protein AAGL10_05700 [Pseudomonadota bacterium]